MNDDMMMDILEAVRMQGMQDGGWLWNDNEASLDCEAYDIFQLAFIMPDDADDPVWNSVRYGYAEAFHAAVNAWYRQYRLPREYEALDDATQKFVDLCLEERDPQAIPWREYAAASGVDWPASFQDAQWEILEESEGRYNFEVRHTIAVADDGYTVYTRVGGGWQDVWAVDIEVFIPRDATKAELINQIKAAYPAALTEGL